VGNQTHISGKRGLMMGVSYWARWACSGHVEDLPNLLLPCVLAEGYDLLTCDGDRHVLDHGGVMKKIAWSLNGGRWCDAPIVLTITYSFSPTRTVANFCWKLTVQPYPTTQKEQASFEAWVRSQLSRIVAALDEEIEHSWTESVTDEPVSLPPPSSHGGTSHMLSSDLAIGTDTAALAARSRSCLQYASAYVEEPPHCNRCWKPAVPVPGTTGRYYCLSCRQHLSRRIPADAK
jgi:hypothetical protein